MAPWCDARTLEMIADAPPCSVQSAHHRSGGDAESLGGRGVGEATDVDEFHHRAEWLIEACQCCFDLGIEADIDHRVGLFVAGQLSDPVGTAVGVAQQLGTSAPISIDVGVAQNRQQPRTRVTTVEAVDGAVCAQQGVLHQVLGVCVVTGE